MSTEKYTIDEVCDRGDQIYEEQIKHLVEPEHNGKFIVIDIESGDYEMDEEHPAASKRMRERRPQSVRYAGRIGEDATYHIGWGTGRTND